MSWHRILTTLAALLIAVMGLAGVTTLAYASPSTTFSPPKEGAKVTLGQSSIDGPALGRFYGQTVLAWTGTDPAHHLNVMTSTDGLHYSNKVVLPEMSLWRPALGFIDSGRGAPYGTILLAWTGTDPAHTLNLEFIQMPGFTVSQKITYWGETSFTAPSLVSVNGDVNSDVYLTWSGTDSAHTLNLIRQTTHPLAHTKHTFWGWTSISRPDLSVNPLNMAWTGPNNHIYFASSSDGVHWTMPSTSPLAHQSAWAPSMIGIFNASPSHWLAWTGSGTTSTRNINVQDTQHFPSWSDAGSTTTLGETALSSPELVYNGAGSTRQVLLAWTGTDSLHRLNVADLYVTA
jgi:hypothetical protein